MIGFQVSSIEKLNEFKYSIPEASGSVNEARPNDMQKQEFALYQSLIRPLCFQFDPEFVHNCAGFGLSFGPFSLLWKSFYKWKNVDFPELKTSFCGIDCSHPIGLAAGFDKDAKMFPQLPWLGFSHLEIGTVTGEGQPGNPKKRLFRLPKDKALINRMGFNNEGVESAAARLKRFDSIIPLGGNIGKTKIVPLGDPALRDYEHSFLTLRDHVDYLVVNVSSPNTPGLRTLQDKGPLCELLTHLNSLNTRGELPILLKIAPDLNHQQLEEIIEVVIETKIPGVIATNTSIARTGLTSHQDLVETIGAGGLSGRPVFKASTEILKFLRKNLPAEVDLIGVGGIFSGQDVYEKLKAGARAVQIYTGFIYNGPSCVFNMKKELADLMNRDGVHSIDELVGVSAKS